MQKPSRERRWIILCEDGRHVTVGRHSDPTEEELEGACAQLKGLGIGGWLAITEGRYYSRDQLSVMMVRELNSARAPWEIAVQHFLAARAQAVRPAQGPKVG